MKKNEVINKVNSLTGRYILAIFTDKVDFVNELKDVDNLLEVRVFNEEGEFRAYRDVLCSEYKSREIIDESEYDGYFDQTQYLDIDTTKCLPSDTEKTTIGGGIFHMPEDVAEKMMLNVRYYYRYNDDGVAEKCDWRLVGFSDSEVN